MLALYQVTTSVIGLGDIGIISTTLLLCLAATVIATTTFGQLGIAPSAKFVTVPFGWFLSVRLVAVLRLHYKLFWFWF